MSLNISKSFLEVENIKLSNQGKELNYKQIENLYYKLNYLDNNNDNYIDSFKDMINKLENSYINKSSKMLEYFVKNLLKFKNIKTGEIKDYTYNKSGIFKYYNDFNYKVKDNNIKDLELTFKEHNKGEFLSNKDKLYSIKKISKVMYLDYINIEKEKIFITFTLPNKSFHKFNKFGFQTDTYNSSDKFEENIIKGLKYLNEIHRYFYHTLKYQIKRYCNKQNIKDKNKMIVDFIKILEPHKSLDGHLHSLFYIDNEFTPLIKKVYNMTVEKFELLQTKFEILENSKGATYLNKYLLKTTKTENLFYNQYKRYFNDIRFFSSSGFRHTTQEKIEIVYKYINENNKELIEMYKKTDKPLYYHLEELIINNVFEFEEKEIIRTSINYLEIKNQYKKLVATFKKLENKQKHKNKEKLKNRITQYFKNKIIRNLKDYITIIKHKSINKVFYKKELIINKEDWEILKVYGVDFQNLKLNPFKNEENFNKTFNYN